MTTGDDGIRAMPILDKPLSLLSRFNDTVEQVGSKAFIIDVKLFWFYLVVPAGFYLLAAVGVEHILRAIKALLDPASVPRHRPLAGLETSGNAPNAP